MAKKKRYDYVRDHFKKLGWLTSKIETWDGTNMSDAFGCADMLVVAPTRLIMVQVTGASDWQAHNRKILPLNTLPAIATNETLYQVGADLRKIGNADRWVYQVGIYTMVDGKPAMKMLSTFKEQLTDLGALENYEKN